MRAAGGAACLTVLACVTLLARQHQAGGRTVLWENYNEPDYFDRQVRQARADGIRCVCSVLHYVCVRMRVLFVCSMCVRPTVRASMRCRSSSCETKAH